MKTKSHQKNSNHNSIPLEEKHSLNLGELLSVEINHIKSKRAEKKQNINVLEDSLGIALSGGGIRSATISLGIMEELNKLGLIEKADYFSSVSGGGYLSSYIQSALNKSQPLSYDQLFDHNVIKHLRDYRMHFFIWPEHKFLSSLVLLSVVISSFILNWLWIILPLCFIHFAGLSNLLSYLILILLILIPALLLSPNFTSLHRYYKNRLKKAYLWLDKKILLKNLTNINAPYPLINATVHVDKDDYETESVTYRGRINSNYFLFSPLYCGSQVTHYTRTSNSLYSNLSLATAMATSGAAVNTFTGNIRLGISVRWILTLANMKLGFLAPSPLLKKWFPVFWPSYMLLEILGKAKTSSYKIQVSDGGHIENLGIYELLRRKVKTIIAIDSGHDDKFDFSDLRNLIIRARNELGMVIEFDESTGPINSVKSSLITGSSKKHFSIAKVYGLEGSYAQDYNGILVYIKSSVLPIDKFKVRSLKKEAEFLRKEGSKEDFMKKRRELDYTMYRTYTPDFPHQSTSNQFFREEQWDAYYNLGKSIGKKTVDSLGIKKTDSRINIHTKCLKLKMLTNDT